MIDCDKAVEQLNRYVDRELDEDDLKQVRAHLDECPECSHVFDFQAEMKRLVRRESCAGDSAPDRLRRWVQELGSRDPGAQPRG